MSTKRLEADSELKTLLRRKKDLLKQQRIIEAKIEQLHYRKHLFDFLDMKEDSVGYVIDGGLADYVKQHEEELKKRGIICYSGLTYRWSMDRVHGDDYEWELWDGDEAFAPRWTSGLHYLGRHVENGYSLDYLDLIGRTFRNSNRLDTTDTGKRTISLEEADVMLLLPQKQPLRFPPSVEIE